jgi:hypothetical protein
VQSHSSWSSHRASPPPPGFTGPGRATRLAGPDSELAHEVGPILLPAVPDAVGVGFQRPKERGDEPVDPLRLGVHREMMEFRDHVAIDLTPGDGVTRSPPWPHGQPRPRPGVTVTVNPGCTVSLSDQLSCGRGPARRARPPRRRPRPRPRPQ